MSTSQRLYHGKPLQPYRLGVLVDFPDYPGISDAFPDGVRLACEEALLRGVVEREVELDVRLVHAQPWTDGRPMVEAFDDLVSGTGVLGVIGPMTTDNCLAVLPRTEATGVPTGTICGTLSWRGQAAFNLANGGLADEPYVMAAWCVGQGHRRLAVLEETTQIGAEYAEHLRRAASQYGLEITATAPVYTVESQGGVETALKRLRDADADVLVYLGLGGLNQVMRPALEALDWDPPRIQTTAFVSATYNAERAHRLEGWVGVDQYHEGNRVFAAVHDRFVARFGYEARNSAMSTGYDLGHAFCVALGRMRVATPDGLRQALETVRWLPATTGGPNTLITFGPEDHRGFKGNGFLTLRRAHGGTTSLEGVAELEPWPMPAEPMPTEPMPTDGS